MLHTLSHPEGCCRPEAHDEGCPLPRENFLWSVATLGSRVQPPSEACLSVVGKCSGGREPALCRNDSQGGRPESAQGGPAYAVDCPLVLALDSLSTVPGELGRVEHSTLHGGHLEVACRCWWDSVCVDGSSESGLYIKWPGMAGAGGAVAGAPWRLHHVTTWSTPRHTQAGHSRFTRFWPTPLERGCGSAPSPQHHHRRSPAACFSTHPHLSVGLRRLEAYGPGRRRARASLWDGLPRSVPPGAWSPMRPPRCGPGPARLPAYGIHGGRGKGSLS